jgi:peptidoglycan/xylan/chitin deacetylase (PgdA/CDA1 family)
MKCLGKNKRMSDLWDLNTPRLFWKCQPDPPTELWQSAIENSLPILRLPEQSTAIESFLEQTLGEGQFGANHWRLSSARRLYYTIKPVLPRVIINTIKQVSARRPIGKTFQLDWPVEDRYVRFLWEVARQILLLSQSTELFFTPFWPDHKRFAFVLTHDVEGERGLQFVEQLADLEETLGFRSSINIVPRGYHVPPTMMQSLQDRGFEIGIHGLKHDGKLFNSKQNFLKQADLINKYLKEFNSQGFRAPLMHRQPEWMQALEIDYDLSFFDTDPYEPLPGGTMCIWPFFLGHFIEMPYTLVQDSTLMYVLDQNSPRIWLEKINFLAKYYGMALLNSHPDYLREEKCFTIYAEFLRTVRDRNDYWHALPSEVASWWRTRMKVKPLSDPFINYGQLRIQDDELAIAY